MGILDNVAGAVGLPAVHVRMEVREEHIFIDSPFKVKVHLKAGKKQVIIKELTISLIWKEDLSVDVISASDNKFRESHVLEEKKYKQRITIPHGRSKGIVFTFSAKDLPRYHILDRFRLKLHVSVVGAPGITEKMKIEIYPDRTVAAPLISMIDKMGFRPVRPNPRERGTYIKHRWSLIPDVDSYEHIHRVHLHSFDMENGRNNIALEVDLWEHCDGSNGMGIHETIMMNLPFLPEDVLDENGEIEQDMLANQINMELSETEKKFKEMLKMDGRWE